MPPQPRITFGIIVLNGEPYIEYCLRSLYPFAHEIIVVEGAYWASAELATPDGHSTDDTLAAVERFRRDQDPRGIVQLVTRDGLWDDLTHQSQAYAERATGDYLWQVDCDEFYLPEDMRKVIGLLAADPSITMMTFKAINFIYDIKYRLISGRDFQREYIEYRRLFKFGPGYRYVEHEPPTVVDANGRDLAAVNHLDKDATARLGVHLYHCWALFEDKVAMKARIYVKRDWQAIAAAMPSWRANWQSLADPFHLQSDYAYRTWIKRFTGPWPPELARLGDDVAAGLAATVRRDNDDVERLLKSPGYHFKKAFVAAWERLKGADSYLRRRWAYRLWRMPLKPPIDLARWVVGKLKDKR